MSLTNVIIYGMAVWRMASMLVNETGPWNMFLKLRYWAGIEHEGMIPDNFFGGVLSCVWCTSIWIAFFFTVFLLLSPKWSLVLAVSLSFSTVAIIIDKIVNKN